MVRRWAVTVGLVCGAGAFAQPWPAVTAVQGSPPPAPRYEPTSTPPDTEALYLIRTAGQNDRTVKVVHPADPTDPASLAEVIDTVTKKTFQIPGKVLAKLPKVSATGFEPPASLPQQDIKPKPAPPLELPPIPASIQRTTPPTVVVPPSNEKMVTTWKADDPPAMKPPVATHTPVSALPTASPSVVQSVAVASSAADPWRATGEPKAAPPLPPQLAAGPKLIPVPTFRATPLPAPPGASDPWRPTGE